MTHLIFTGRNGNGKTSVLDALSRYLNSMATSNSIIDNQDSLYRYQATLTKVQQQGIEDDQKANVHPGFRLMMLARLEA